MAELGKKHECLSCGVKFYDLGNAEIVCPKCGANQAELSAEEAPAKSKAKTKKKKAAAKPKKAAKSKKKDAEKEGDQPDDKGKD
jgi:uncharacterized protein (TIGR02300 family)